MTDSRITWTSVHKSTFPALVTMAQRAGMDTSGWKLIHSDTPVLVVNHDTRISEWSTARECAEYMRAWTTLLSIQAADRDQS